MRGFFFGILLILFFSGCSVNDESENSSSGRTALPIIVGGGDTVDPGATTEITWPVTVEQPSTVLIEVSYDGGLTWHLKEQNVVNSGRYEFQTPDIPGAQFRVRVVAENSVIAESSDIVVSGATRPLIVSGGQSTVSPGESINLTWVNSETQPQMLDLQISSDGGLSFISVQTGIENSGSMIYAISNEIEGDIFLRMIDPVTSLIVAISPQIKILNSVVNGATSLALGTSGQVIENSQYQFHIAIGEPFFGNLMSAPAGSYKFQINFVGVTTE